MTFSWNKNKVIGLSLILIAFILYIFFTMWIIVSKITDYDIPMLNFMKEDYYYCLAIPIIFPVTFLIGFFKWFAYAYFRRC
jgi:hypothetical protein